METASPTPKSAGNILLSSGERDSASEVCEKLMRRAPPISRIDVPCYRELPPWCTYDKNISRANYYDATSS